MAGILDTIANGGCYWQRKEGSPGHSFAIPNGTLFKVAIDGPQSNRFYEGVCQDGYFVTEDGVKHVSANDAVGAVRDISTNAFLYISFHLGGCWRKADKIRESAEFVPDEVEEEALQMAKDMVRDRVAKEKSDKDVAQITKIAANLVLANESLTESARSGVENRRSIASKLVL